MFCKRLLALPILLGSMSGVALSAECHGTPAEEVKLDLWSTQSLSSPDQRWKFLSVGPHSPEQRAPLFFQNTESSKKWLRGWIERSGTAFWSEDSKRLFLRDAYAADETKIRVFDLTGAVPREIKGLDSRIQKAIHARIPRDKTTQWLYYPEVCFDAHNSSTIIVVADAPLVPKQESGSGVPFGLKLTINLTTLQIVESVSAIQPGQGSRNAGNTPGSWHKLDAGPFSILAPSGWEFHQLTGVDSYVGEFVGEGIVLTFDFGRYSNPLKEEKKPVYDVIHKFIGGRGAKIVSPRIPGHGTTGVYFRNVGDSNALTLFGHDLTSAQQELALKMFVTLRFGGTTPQYVLPLPPRDSEQRQ